MTARGWLREGLDRVLPDHRRGLAHELRRDLDAIVVSLGINGDPLLLREAARVAMTMVRAREAARAWSTLVEKRATGRGRRPSPRAIERAARRVAMDDQTATQGLDRLRELAAKRNGHRVPTPAEVLEQMTGDGRG